MCFKTTIYIKNPFMSYKTPYKVVEFIIIIPDLIFDYLFV